MTTAKDLLKKIEEASRTTRLVKDIRIVDGHKKIVVEREYVEECPDGYKRDPETGACVRMSLKEQRDRSIAATKAANKASTKRNKSISMRRRAALIKD
ncbi:hypothetical protein [Ralstonia phage RP13]|nr:hypothetical protein [Ralstonia phage RP13]